MLDHPVNAMPKENMDTEPEGTLPPKAPELLRKLKWLLLYGPRHKWYVLAAATLLVASIVWFGLGGSLTQFPQTGTRTQSPTGTTSVDQTESDVQEPVDRASITVAGYFQRIDELEDRFLEIREFLDSLKGKLVLWRGYVNRVDDVDDDRIFLSILVDNTFPPGNAAHFVFDESWKTKLYSLQKGDFVEVEGVFTDHGALSPILHGVNLTVVHPNSS